MNRGRSEEVGVRNRGKERAASRMGADRGMGRRKGCEKRGGVTKVRQGRGDK